MRLADFITSDMEPILAQWQAFAATRLPAAGHMGTLELRDHARQILEAVVLDLRTPQTEEAQIAKSKGLARALFSAPATAAQTHAVLRAKSGFDIKQLAAEYRALRASVLQLWIDACLPGQPSLTDVIRFSEAIDQALAESIAHFNAQVEQSRNLLLGMMSHDMRSPLQTILMTARHLGTINAGADVAEAAQRLIRSGAHIQALLDDLVDFNRTNLGLGIDSVPSALDLGTLCAEEAKQFRAAYPGSSVELSIAGDCRGCWDGKRMRQLLSNLVVNAIKYGAPGEAVRIAVNGEEGDVRIDVANRGPAIEPAMLSQIFEPLTRGMTDPDQLGLGLGLYIVREIAKAHGGTAEARSDATETVFTVRLPRP